MLNGHCDGNLIFYICLLFYLGNFHHTHADSLGLGVLRDLQFEDVGAARPGKATASTPQQASQTVRMLCSLTSDPELVGPNRFQSAFNCTYL